MQNAQTTSGGADSSAKKTLRGKWKTVGLPPVNSGGGEVITPQVWEESDGKLAREDVWWHAGLDVDKKFIWAALYGVLARDPRQKVLGPIERFGTDGPGLAQLLAHLDKFHPARVLLENTGVYSNHPYWVLRGHLDPANASTRVIVMNSRVITRHLVANKKTDKVDAQRLAQLASVPEFLEPSYISPPAEFAVRGMLRQRNKVTQYATRVKNRIKTGLSSAGFNWMYDFDAAGQRDLVYAFVQSGTSLGEFVAAVERGATPVTPLAGRALRKAGTELGRWAGVELDPVMQVLLAGHFAELARLDAQVDVYDKIVAEKVMTDETHKAGHDNLQGIVGTGAWSLATILLESGPVNRFHRIGQYLSYAGISNGKDQSAEKDVKKKPNPFSNHMLKAAFKTVAFGLLKQVNLQRADPAALANDCLLAYAARVMARGELSNGKKANKVAAKVARVTYAILKSGKPYDPSYERDRSPAQSGPSKPRNKPLRRVKFLEKTLALCKARAQFLFEESHLTGTKEARDWLQKVNDVLAGLNEAGIVRTLTVQLKQARGAAKEWG